LSLLLLLLWSYIVCRREVDGQATLLGFVGTPWTLAAYAMEGKADRDCKQTKVSHNTLPLPLHAPA
jgi:uroporphyrinogen-III decarboxylase